jgi:trehalose 6-phosphate synthase
VWTKEDLQNLIEERMRDYLFIVVSNRQPYVHTFRKGKIECRRGAGGVITALDPVMKSCSGLWVAYGNGDADHKAVDSESKIKVPPDNPAYLLRRLWLSKQEEDGYYFGYSNQALWPLCHMAFQRPVFNEENWNYYVKVNEKFARAVKQEVGNNKAFIFIQDYHLALLSEFLKKSDIGSQLIIAHFWHIPWPNYEGFRICPQKHRILEGLLHNDLLGFHIRYHCLNFLEAVDREVECKIDRERFSAIRGSHETLIRPYPISVDFQGITDIARCQEVGILKESFIQEYGLCGLKVILGLDRIDYTKGLPERLRAIDRLLQRHPELKEKIVFLQIGIISRIHITRYRLLNDEINALVEEINWRHSTDNWRPVIMARTHLSFKELLALYNLADLCVVSSLHDGMNLVAKEFVCSRADEGGMLILSQFTGAARELTDAILVNPYDCESFSDAIFQALSLSEDERKRRMVRLREIIKQNNIYRWAGKILSELLRFEFKE